MKLVHYFCLSFGILFFLNACSDQPSEKDEQALVMANEVAGKLNAIAVALESAPIITPSFKL